MGDLTLEQVILRIVAFALIAAVHGGAVAAAAAALGDLGPRYDGRLTANPILHADLIGGLLTVLFGAGWLRPSVIDAARLRPGGTGLVLVVVMAFLATLALAELFHLTRPFILSSLGDTGSATYFVFVTTLEQLCIRFALFNLLPLPPLTGQHLLLVILPRSRGAMIRARPFAVMALALLIVSGAADRVLAPLAAATMHTLSLN
jgi:Zn-dependent protease